MGQCPHCSSRHLLPRGLAPTYSTSRYVLFIETSFPSSFKNMSASAEELSGIRCSSYLSSRRGVLNDRTKRDDVKRWSHEQELARPSSPLRGMSIFVVSRLESSSARTKSDAQTLRNVLKAKRSRAEPWGFVLQLSAFRTVLGHGEMAQVTKLASFLTIYLSSTPGSSIVKQSHRFLHGYSREIQD